MSFIDGCCETSLPSVGSPVATPVLEDIGLLDGVGPAIDVSGSGTATGETEPAGAGLDTVCLSGDISIVVSGKASSGLTAFAALFFPHPKTNKLTIKKQVTIYC